MAWFAGFERRNFGTQVEKTTRLGEFVASRSLMHCCWLARPGLCLHGARVLRRGGEHGPERALPGAEPRAARAHRGRNSRAGTGPAGPNGGAGPTAQRGQTTAPTGAQHHCSRSGPRPAPQAPIKPLALRCVAPPVRTANQPRQALDRCRAGRRTDPRAAGDRQQRAAAAH